MKIFVIEGNNTLLSYERLKTFRNEAKKRGWQIVKITGKEKLTLPEIITSRDLLISERLIIVENSTKLKEKELKWLKEKNDKFKGNLVIYHEGTLPSHLVKKLPKIEKRETFEIPILIFKFLDSFYPGNSRNCVKLLHQLKDSQASEFILAMLARHLKDLYVAKVDKGGLTYPGWRKTKLILQASKFQEDDIKNTIKELSMIDVSSKTGGQPVISSLDLLILTKLE